ncbi:D-alanyl-D-alanine carboxypeptidase family protein [Bacillus litorisediminis]|uniref:D-alanyl-D-alanine carboxypeptidase family protein n=1 Tax=Bacillus litorisediminis TaxID=2922713 RepID=UPI001FABC67F|nr:D-alanyl-D-alanine carboxypeptidase family protein [Bacillus litorisediminis]
MNKLIITMISVLFINSIMSSTVFGEDAPAPPTISSEAAIILEADSGQILFDKNADVPMYPASLTKIATAIYAIETGNLDDIVTVSSKAREVDGTRVYLEDGEKVTLKKLLQGLLINSGNDAGVAIAEHLSGSVEQFADDINKYLKNVIGIENTNFENPHGLFDPNHVTTAEDLAKITQYAMHNEVFREIFGTQELEWQGESWDTTLYSHHKIVKGEIPYEEVTGGKNGYVDQSGFTLATTAENNQLDLIVVTLKSSSEAIAYQDTVSLLDFGFNHFVTSSIAEGKTFDVDGVEFMTKDTLFYTYPKSGQVHTEVNKDGVLEVMAQDGTVLASYELDSTEVAAAAEVKKSTASEESNPSVFDGLSDHLLFVLAALAFGIVILFYRQTRKV